MNLAKWDPLKELEEVSNRLNRFFGRSVTHTGSSQDMQPLPEWTPATDISETDAAYLIKAEIPGVQKEDVKVTLHEGVLTISGERRQEKEEKGRKYHRIERSYGSFVRSFRMPEDADESAVKAEFKNGMLKLTLPKSAFAMDKPRAIEVVVS
jgi:HSP20 family protein